MKYIESPSFHFELKNARFINTLISIFDRFLISLVNISIVAQYVDGEPYAWVAFIQQHFNLISMLFYYDLLTHIILFLTTYQVIMNACLSTG